MAKASLVNNEKELRNSLTDLENTQHEQLLNKQKRAQSCLDWTVRKFYKLLKFFYASYYYFFPLVVPVFAFYSSHISEE